VNGGSAGRYDIVNLVNGRSVGRYEVVNFVNSRSMGRYNVVNLVNGRSAGRYDVVNFVNGLAHPIHLPESILQQFHIFRARSVGWEGVWVFLMYPS
jgi:hypothetical protein